MIKYILNYDKFDKKIKGSNIVVKQGEHNVSEICIYDLLEGPNDGDYYVDYKLAAGKKLRIPLTMKNWKEDKCLCYKLPQTVTARAGEINFELVFYRKDSISIYNGINILVQESINAISSANLTLEFAEELLILLSSKISELQLENVLKQYTKKSIIIYNAFSDDANINWGATNGINIGDKVMELGGALKTYKNVYMHFKCGTIRKVETFLPSYGVTSVYCESNTSDAAEPPTFYNYICKMEYYGNEFRYKSIQKTKRKGNGIETENVITPLKDMRIDKITAN